jgi:hypothetical protein
MFVAFPAPILPKYVRRVWELSAAHLLALEFYQLAAARAVTMTMLCKLIANPAQSSVSLVFRWLQIV